MFRFVSIFLVFLAAANAVTDVEWTVFKAKHGKVYSREEEYFRRMIYEENLQKIHDHNILFSKGLKSYFLKENEFADKTHVEFVKTMNGYRPPSSRLMRMPARRFNMTSMPEAIDWVKKGFVAEVKNQGECGSCWSFSATGAMEGAHKKATGNLVSLSEQNLIDCSSSYGNDGCDGGVVDYAFQYVIDNKGVDTEASYPYEGKVGDCRFNPSNVGATIKSFKDVEQDSEPALQEAVANVGPVSVAIDASHESLQLYGGGVYDEPMCTTEVDHAVLAVGYGTLEGKQFWKVKNSWGPSWGLDGYVLMSRNKDNQCGIASQACYPVA